MTNKEAINLLDNLLGMVEDNQNSDYDKALKMAIDALKQTERKKGKWINDGDPATWLCSNCGYRVTVYNNTKFCPNCRCEMER